MDADPESSYHCRKCGTTSYNPDDISSQECGFCREDALTARPGARSNKKLFDGREATLYDTVAGARILIGSPDDMGGDEEYMFDSIVAGMRAFNDWDGYGEPDFWIRHSFKSQIRRRDLNTGEIRVEQRT